MTKLLTVSKKKLQKLFVAALEEIAEENPKFGIKKQFKRARKA